MTSSGNMPPVCSYSSRRSSASSHWKRRATWLRCHTWWHAYAVHVAVRVQCIYTWLRCHAYWLEVATSFLSWGRGIVSSATPNTQGTPQERLAAETQGGNPGRICGPRVAALSTGGRTGSIAALVTTSEPSAETILPSALSLPSLIASLTWLGLGLGLGLELGLGLG